MAKVEIWFECVATVECAGTDHAYVDRVEFIGPDGTLWRGLYVYGSAVIDAFSDEINQRAAEAEPFDADAERADNAWSDRA